MNTSFPFLAATAATVVTLAASSAGAAGSAGARCEAAKLKESGKLASCLLKSMAKSAQAETTDDPAALAKCEGKFEDKVAAAELAADGACPDSVDAEAIAGSVLGLATDLRRGVSGERFHDNGDGTVTDVATGVIWQATTSGTGCDNCADEPRGYDDALVWLGALGGVSGGEALGGRSDWGLPSLEELQSILDCSTPPCTIVDPVLGPLPAIGASPTYLLSGSRGNLPMSTIPCFQVVVLNDGSIDCLEPSAEGSSRARIMNNAR